MNQLLTGLRLLLGAILVVTSVNYFLPALVPFLPAQTWEDPMSIRLIAAFDKSGLLAVAKFVQLAGGALLLTNRAVPFALAAMLSVNVCAAFIAVLIEGNVLLGLLALALLALNGVLALAYLPYYRDALAADQFADGENAEAGGHYNSLLVNPFSGAPATSYIGGASALIAALAFYWYVVPFTNGTTGLYTLIFPSAVLVAGFILAVVRKKAD